MSDFLRHLVERHASRSPQPTVRPRAASRFELPSISGGVPGEPPEVASVRAATDHGRSGSLGDRTGHGVSDTAKVGNQPSSGDRPATGDRAGQSVDAFDSLASRFTSVPRARIREEAGEPSRKARSPAALGPRLVSARDAKRDAIEPAPTVDERAHPVEPARRSAIVRRSDSAPHIVHGVPRREGTPGTPASSEPDVVRIHIGRVEVRATIAPTPERPRTTPPTPDSTRALSLTSYLDSKRRP